MAGCQLSPGYGSARGEKMSKPEILALIPARGGSKGIPRKNIRPFAGQPLIAYSIAAGLQADTVTRVIVTTDDEEIAEVARGCGAETPFMRPAELAQDGTLDLPVFQHALNWLAATRGLSPAGSRTSPSDHPDPPARPCGPLRFPAAGPSRSGLCARDNPRPSKPVQDVADGWGG